MHLSLIHIFFNSGELHAAVPADSARDLFFRAIVFSPDYLCGATNDILRVKYVSPVMNGELRLPSLIRQGTQLYDRISPAFDTVYTLLQDRPPFFEFAAKAGMLAALDVYKRQSMALSNTLTCPFKARMEAIETAIAWFTVSFTVLGSR